VVTGRSRKEGKLECLELQQSLVAARKKGDKQIKMLHSQALSIQKASSLCKEEITHQKIDSKMNTLWQWNSWSNITPQHVGELKSLKNKTHISPQ
jgi:hypothetical protein